MIIDEHIREYINSLEQDLPAELYELEKRLLERKVPIIRKEAQTLLRFLLLTRRPERILEVGTAEGFSSILMSEYMPKDCRITTIEKVPMRIEQAALNLGKARRAADITFLNGEAQTILEELEGTYDFIFLDAAKGQYMSFLPELKRLLPKDGMLVTDNVLQDGSLAKSKFSIERRDRTIHMRMREYLYALTHDDFLETVVLPVGDGMTLSVKLNDQIGMR